ncbi:PREDICTED: uncharacterized protein LOC104600727 isoform X3 [Nelumbo nucifera]|uniref:Uncharacterized protein LOC104600727 isoform X3 n=1 Tax=Nelumbo nucifera TaxID=4432 RepID=A0A1U8AIZ3_NELNU|nr:PREDICTED: uncharacterized protein LOC104600727 isoform X3 [Nelumbo nucifera]
MGVWDTQRTLVPNHSHSSSLLNNKSPNTVRSPTSQTKQITTTTAPVTPKKNLTASELLDLNIHNPTKEKSGYLGSEKWLPALRKVKRPRSIYNAASLAYIGDCIYEDVLLKNLLKGDYLTERKVGYLCLTNAKRLEEVMQKLGFLTGASTQLIIEENM